MKKAAVYICITLAIISFAPLVLAQPICPDPNTSASSAQPQICVTNPADPSGSRTFEQILDGIISWLTVILIPILTIIIIIGAFQMLTARDNEAQFLKGRKTVTYAAIGAAIILLANGILLVIQSFLNTQGNAPPIIN